MPAPPHVTIHHEPCPYYADGGSCSYADTDDVYLEPGATRFERQHELGHQFDRQVLTDPDRAWLTSRLGFKPGAWNRGTGPGNRSPDESFADAYAACAIGLVPLRRGKAWWTSYGYFPAARQHRVICNAIAVLALVRV
jgi:hypothetical protein